MSTTKESGQIIPEEIEDLALLREITGLNQTVRIAKRMDYNKVDWKAVRDADALIPGKVIEILRRKLEGRLDQTTVTPNEQARQVMLTIPVEKGGAPPSFIFVNYPELEAIDPGYRTLIDPFTEKPKQQQSS